VIPTYNRAAVVERAIASIKEPGLAVEIIVVDDGSTDDTRERLRDRHDIVYLRQERNAGQAAARNVGIGVAGGHYIAFLDSDDLRLPGTLFLQSVYLDARRDCALVYGGYRYLGEAAVSRRAARLPEGDVYARLQHFNIISPVTAMIRACVLREVGGFDPRYRCNEEWDLWLRICSRHPVCAVDTDVAILTPPLDDSHASGDPVRTESASIDVFRAHLRSQHCRPVSPDARRRLDRDFTRTRIDLMLWKVLARGQAASAGLRVRCALACLGLDPRYMMFRHNLKNLVKLFMLRRQGLPSGGYLSDWRGLG
jgi:glycosyltransferase involved in cell wall biosynthesis